MELYTQIPEPKVVVACGSCTSTGGVFRGMYNVEDGLDRYIPVDVYVGGCAPHPEQIIDGIAKALEILEQKNKTIERPKRLMGEISEFDGQTDKTNMAGKI